MSINKRIILALILLLVVGTVSFTLLHRSPKYIEQQKQIESTKVIHAQDTKLPYAYLNNVIAQSGAACSVYFHSLDTGEVFYNYSGKMPAGEMIRLYVAAAVLQQVKDKDLDMNKVYKLTQKDKKPDSPALGKLQPGSPLTLQNLLEDMLLQQDDTATYKLIAIAGRDDINTWLAQQGFADTVVGTHELPTHENAGDGLTEKEKRLYSYTSVNDTVNLLNRLYQGKAVDEENDAYLLSLLQRQPQRDMLGALLPRDVRLDGLQSDNGQVLGACAIVYAREKYILAILMDKSVRPKETRKTMNQISSIIFNTVNDKEVFKK